MRIFTMDVKISSLVLSILLQVMHLKNVLTNAIPFQPTVEIVTGHSHVFTGDTVRLKCNAPATPYNSTWTYIWYNGPKQLPQNDEQLVFLEINRKQKGKYCCQGIRLSSVKDIPSDQSLPVEITVTGGWAILDAPSKGIVGYPLTMTCRVRGKYLVNNVVLYIDGVEVLKQKHPKLILDNVTLANTGRYTCRASWVQNQRTHSVISPPVSIQVVEPLTQPTLVIEENEEMRSLSMLKLYCVLEYNIPAPAPPIFYYFYINDEHLGTITLNNFTLVKRSRGAFKCESKVLKLGLSRMSEPKYF